MTQTELLIGPATVMTNVAGDLLRAQAGVYCVGGRVQEVGPFAELEKKHPKAQRLDAAGKLIFPGLINAHHHLYSTFSRGMPIAPGTPLSNFTQILEGIWWRLDRALDLESVEAGAYPPILDGLRWGTTTIVDHHASPSAIRGSLDALAQVCEQFGVRASLCYEITDRNGEEGARLGVEENAAFAQRVRGSKRLQAMLGLHASFTVNDETLALAARTVDPSVPVHIHSAEDKADVVQSRALFSDGVVERMQKHGLLRKNSIFVHGVHLSAEQLALIAKAGAWLVHNPESNANNAVGHLDVLRALELGVPVALGTDGMASNMLRAAKSAYLMVRQARLDPTVGFDLPRRLLLENNVRLARTLFGEPLLGSIVPGAPAELCVIDYDSPTPITEANFDGHLVFGITECSVLATVTEGQVRWERGRLMGVDAAALDTRIQAAAASVWKRLAELA